MRENILPCPQLTFPLVTIIIIIVIVLMMKRRFHKTLELGILCMAVGAGGQELIGLGLKNSGYCVRVQLTLFNQ